MRRPGSGQCCRCHVSWCFPVFLRQLQEAVLCFLNLRVFDCRFSVSTASHSTSQLSQKLKTTYKASTSKVCKALALEPVMWCLRCADVYFNLHIFQLEMCNRKMSGFQKEPLPNGYSTYKYSICLNTQSLTSMRSMYCALAIFCHQKNQHILYG